MDKVAEERHAVETAWRIHASVQDWIGKVDAKASFAFGLEAAVFTATVALTSRGNVFHDLTSWVEVALLALGLTLIGVAAFFASIVVAPRIRSSKKTGHSAHEFLYFGHLKDWKSRQLRDALLEQSPLHGLTEQLIVLSRIAWRKHRLVQISVISAMSGAASLVLCFVLTTLGGN